MQPVSTYLVDRAGTTLDGIEGAEPLAKLALQGAKRSALRDSVVNPMVVIVYETKIGFVQLPGFTGVGSKNHAAAFIRKLVSVSEPEGVAFVSEVWMRTFSKDVDMEEYERTRPGSLRDELGSIEGIHVNAEWEDGRSHMLACEFHRGVDGKSVGFGPEAGFDAQKGKVSGRFAGLFDQKG